MMRAVSLVNLASVRALQEAVGSEIDPRRFRANIHLDGLAAWAEQEWIGRDIRIGALAFRAARLTRRCAAIDVNPVTAARDTRLPGALVRHFGHPNLGIYLGGDRGWRDRTGRCGGGHVPECRRRNPGVAPRDRDGIDSEDAAMAKNLKPGDAVSWDSSQGKVKGVVEKKITSETRIKTHVAKPTSADPEYVVRSDKTGAKAAHKPDALKKR